MKRRVGEVLMAVAFLFLVGGLGSADVDDDLLTACERGNVTLTRLLLAAEADFDLGNEDGYTALMYANRGQVESIAAAQECTRLLLQAGAEVNRKNTHGFTALMYSCREHRPLAVRLLVASGAELDTQNNIGRTALSYASSAYNVEAARVLLQSGATVDLQDENGTTALMEAVNARSHFSYEMVELLIGAGAKVDLADDRGKTALYFAWSYSHDLAVQLLLSAGADKGVLDEVQNDMPPGGWDDAL